MICRNSFRRILNLDNTVALELKSHASFLKQLKAKESHDKKAPSEPAKPPAEKEAAE